MNEIIETRALRDDCPLPDDARLAPLRDRVLDAARADGAGRRPTLRGTGGGFPRRRIVLTAAATAAVAVTGIVVADLPGGTDIPADGPRLLSARASANALELAANTVEQLGATEPGPKQWVYEKSTSFQHGTPQSAEQWTRWDGTGSASLPGVPRSGDISDFDPNKLQVWYGPNQEEKWKKEGYDDRSQRQFYRFLATLPGDPDRMMRRIRQEHAIGDIEGETPAQRDWREIHVLYRSVLIPPKVQAGMFRALAKIPGARVEQGVEDPLGRKAIAVTVNYPERTANGLQGKQEIFFDPETYAYLGAREEVPPLESITTNGTKMPLPAEADSAIVVARAAWGVVDKPGARP